MHKRNRIAKNCPAFHPPDKQTIRNLREFGDIGIIVRRDKRTKKPVFYIWQLFTYIRLTQEDIEKIVKIATDRRSVCSHKHCCSKQKSVR